MIRFNFLSLSIRLALISISQTHHFLYARHIIILCCLTTLTVHNRHIFTLGLKSLILCTVDYTFLLQDSPRLFLLNNSIFYFMLNRQSVIIIIQTMQLSTTCKLSCSISAKASLQSVYC